MTANHTERTLMTVEECDAQILSAQYVLDNPDDYDIEVRVQADKDKRRYGYFRDYAAALQAERRRADNLANTLRGAAGRAQEILDVLDSGNEPLAFSGYGYEHMGDYTRDVRPLCEMLVGEGTAHEVLLRARPALSDNPANTAENLQHALRAIEWCWDGDTDRCPSCGMTEEKGHDHSCLTAAALAVFDHDRNTV